MPKHIYMIEHLTNMGFVKLGKQPGKETVYGIVQTSPRFNCCLSNVAPASFIQNTNVSIIKAAIIFQLQELNNLTHPISNETKV